MTFFLASLYDIKFRLFRSVMKNELRRGAEME